MLGRNEVFQHIPKATHYMGGEHEDSWIDTGNIVQFSKILERKFGHLDVDQFRKELSLLKAKAKGGSSEKEPQTVQNPGIEQNPPNAMQ